MIETDIIVNGIKVDRAIEFIDKSDWGEGPWQEERYDKLQFIDEATGLDCLLVRNPWSGHLCGYVGVPEGHPLFGVHYADADDLAEPDEDGYREFKVHGGLTFAGLCQEGGEESGICHIPAPGRPDRIHWFGFDAMHAWDLGPATEALLLTELRHRRRSDPETVYRTAEYMQAECAKLAAQFASL